MTFPRTHASLLFLGSCVLGALVSPAVQAEDYVTGTLAAAQGRCADFGEDFIDLGSGICGRVGSAARVQLGTRSATANGWAGGGTSNATLRSTDPLPQDAGVRHLRVRNGLDTSPYQ